MEVEIRKMENTKIIGKASCFIRKTTGEPSWLTIMRDARLEASPIEAPSIEASSVVYFCINFPISNF
jgi:hypothetical protein